MCVYNDILGSGEVLVLQVLTLVSIIAAIAFWIFVYWKNNVKLEPFLFPIILWIIFGTLDIVITVKGTFFDPLREGNMLARFIFSNIGYFGPVIASILWISLWALAVLLINRKIKERELLSLIVFYSLAAGHFTAFSTWYAPFCDLAFNKMFEMLPGFVRAVLIGFTLSIGHLHLINNFSSCRH
ncbi:hypothetical protein JXA56_03530 [Candidatus Micrarchaeota archaeon]|nr:hypothetical protein [Candidatus Micrarchaeota archaeon]